MKKKDKRGVYKSKKYREFKFRPGLPIPPIINVEFKFRPGLPIPLIINVKLLLVWQH